MFDAVTGVFDVIVSNPPYIPSGEVPKLMPRCEALSRWRLWTGGRDGLYFYRKIVASCPEHLKPGGRILFEIGYDQGRAVSGLLEEAGFQEIRIVKDLAGNDRVVSGMLPQM